MRKKLFLILVIIESLFLLFWGIKSYYTINLSQKEIRKVEEKLEQLKLENQRLKEQINSLEDPFYLEKMAREKLGLAKEGEIVYKILPAPSPFTPEP